MDPWKFDPYYTSSSSEDSSSDSECPPSPGDGAAEDSEESEDSEAPLGEGERARFLAFAVARFAAAFGKDATGYVGKRIGRRLG